MSTESLAGKIIKVTLITGAALVVLTLLATYSAMHMQRPMMSGEWWSEEDAISVSASSSAGSIGFSGGMMDSFAVRTATAPESVDAIAEARIVKTGSVDMTTKDVNEAIVDIGLLATSQGGFIQSSALSENEVGEITGYVTVRIPSDIFEQTMNGIKAFGIHVNTESTTGEDVTAQYIDIEARLSAAQAQEDQYLIILEDATTVGEVLAVQEHLSIVRSEIESLQGQLTYLADRTDLSTISVSLTEETTAGTAGDTKFDPLRDANRAIDFAITLGQQALSVLIWVAILGIAVGVPVGMIWFVVRFFVRRSSEGKRRK